MAEIDAKNARIGQLKDENRRLREIIFGRLDTCEDRNYVCCESLTPAEHRAKFGYVSASDDDN